MILNLYKGLDRSFFYEDIFLTLHDFHFCIWKADVDDPIFSSLLIRNATITSGSFSPFRPGIIIIGRSDGILDIWDFMDQSHKWTMQHSVVPKIALTCLKFHTFLSTQHVLVKN